MIHIRRLEANNLVVVRPHVDRQANRHFGVGRLIDSHKTSRAGFEGCASDSGERARSCRSRPNCCAVYGPTIDVHVGHLVVGKIYLDRAITA